MVNISIHLIIKGEQDITLNSKVYRFLAGAGGIEPPFAGPKPAVLPLDYAPNHQTTTNEIIADTDVKR